MNRRRFFAAIAAAPVALLALASVRHERRATYRGMQLQIDGAPSRRSTDVAHSDGNNIFVPLRFDSPPPPELAESIKLWNQQHRAAMHEELFRG